VRPRKRVRHPFSGDCPADHASRLSVPTRTDSVTTPRRSPSAAYTAALESPAERWEPTVPRVSQSPPTTKPSSARASETLSRRFPSSLKPRTSDESRPERTSESTTRRRRRHCSRRRLGEASTMRAGSSHSTPRRGTDPDQRDIVEIVAVFGATTHLARAVPGVLDRLLREINRASRSE